MTCGFLVIDKPVGLTSHDVVAIVRSTMGIRKVGHTGTLDPFATGVLPLALGPATRLIQYLDEDLKVYDATILLGRSTDTGDPTGEVLAEAPVPDLQQSTVEDLLDSMKGPRMQAPHLYSAVKVNGRRLYSYARAGEHVEIEKRPIRIDHMHIVKFDLPRIRIRIQCGRGTYARVLAEEIAEALGTVGHLESLRRCRSGNFVEESSLNMVDLSMIVAGREDWQQALRSGKGEERVPWKPRDEVRAKIMDKLLDPSEALSHLPEFRVPESMRTLLIKSGTAPGLRVDLPTDTLFKACSEDRMLALMKQSAKGPKVVRMVAQPER